MRKTQQPDRVLQQLDPEGIGLLAALDQAQSARVTAEVRAEQAATALLRAAVALERIRHRFLMRTLAVEDLDKAIAAVCPDKAKASERAA